MLKPAWWPYRSEPSRSAVISESTLNLYSPLKGRWSDLGRMVRPILQPQTEGWVYGSSMGAPIRDDALLAFAPAHATRL